MDESKLIKERHKGDLKTLFRIYQSDKPFYSNLYFKISVFISLIITFVSFIAKVEIYKLINTISDIEIGLLPSLLGFNLGAYILIVGFGSTEVLSIVTQPLKGQNNFSFYQKLNGVLGFSVIFQIIALFLSFLFKIWDFIQTSIIWPDILIEYFVISNIIALFIINLSLIYSCFLLISVVKHVFMFAQTIHLCIYNNHKKNNNNNSDKDCS